ncbi:MAG TPA: hypothetical protein VG274_00070 [Rhizomicrobium sp.]|jgi:hypothetical protein|nr:hypothetical protein [Rhizomicrobium sp.]
MPKRFTVFAVAMLLSSPALAADLRGEIMNAAEHAEYSGEATTIGDAHMHLHHSLNCLVGPNGEGFDPHSLNPCVHSGNGVIPDTTDAKLIAVYRSAAAKCREGLATNDIAVEQSDAIAAAKLIVATLKSVK